MATKRVKMTVAAAIDSREELERAVSAIAMATIARDKMTAEMEGKLKAIRDGYQDQLGQVNVEIDAELKRLNAWSDAHRAEFAERKSLVLVHGTIGYRTGQPRLKTLRGWTWDRVLDTCKRTITAFVRVKEEVDKQALLAAVQGDPLVGETLGVAIVQDETFFCDPKRDDLPENGDR